MSSDDDLQDPRTRAENRRHKENAQRTQTSRGRWIVVHSFKATTSERVMAILGAIILLAYLVALLLDHLGLLPKAK